VTFDSTGAYNVQAVPADALGRLTKLTIDAPARESVFSLSVQCADPSLIKYEWMCMAGVCIPSKRGRAGKLPSALADRLTAMEPLVGVDSSKASASADAFVRLARQLLTDVREVTAAACTLGCSSAVERDRDRATKLATAPFHFSGAEPYEDGGTFQRERSERRSRREHRRVHPDLVRLVLSWR
jgi:hypothetical protein